MHSESNNPSFKQVRMADLMNSRNDESLLEQQSRNYLPGVASTVVQYEDICVTCGLKLSHWYHYYSDIYGPFLFHRCPKITAIAGQTHPKAKLTQGCWYYFKFVLWFLLIPILTLLAVITMVFNVFSTFVFQPIHFQYRNMDRNKKCRCCFPVYSFYFFLGLVLLALELVIPILATPICILLGYFVHVYGFLRHRTHRMKLKRASSRAFS